jgi:dimethylaniline monooxygenase (N-oxide forming)
MDARELIKNICVIGSGPAGLVTAQVLLQDGFKNVSIITRDKSPGGTWAAERVPHGLKLNKYVSTEDIRM